MRSRNFAFPHMFQPLRNNLTEYILKIFIVKPNLGIQTLLSSCTQTCFHSINALLQMFSFIHCLWIERKESQCYFFSLNTGVYIKACPPWVLHLFRRLFQFWPATKHCARCDSWSASRFHCKEAVMDTGLAEVRSKDSSHTALNLTVLSSVSWRSFGFVVPLYLSVGTR